MDPDNLADSLPINHSALLPPVTVICCNYCQSHSGFVPQPQLFSPRPPHHPSPVALTTLSPNHAMTNVYLTDTMLPQSQIVGAFYKKLVQGAQKKLHSQASGKQKPRGPLDPSSAKDLSKWGVLDTALVPCPQQDLAMPYLPSAFLSVTFFCSSSLSLPASSHSVSSSSLRLYMG